MSEKKKVIDRISEWWKEPHDKAVAMDVELNKRHASRGQISTSDNGISTPVSGDSGAVEAGLTDNEKDNLKNQNGPFLDPTEGPMPARYHRNKHDDFNEGIGDEPLSKSKYPVDRAVAESMANDSAYADRKKWEAKRKMEDDKREARREKLNRWLVGKHNGR